MVKIEKLVQQYITSYETKNGIRWRAVIPDGKGGQVRKQGFIDKSSALSFAKTKYQNILLRPPVEDIGAVVKYTLEEYSKVWLDEKKRNGLADRTLDRYEDMVELFINPYLGAFKLRELKKAHLKNFINDMQDDGATTYNVRSAILISKMILRQAIEDDYMPFSNILTIKTPKHEAKDPVFWDIEEFNTFLKANVGRKYHNLWKFILHTGTRAGEAAGLKWDCVNFNLKSGDHVGFITIRRVCLPKTRKIVERTKNGKIRTIPIFPQIREMLLEMKSKATGEFVFGDTEPIEISHLSRTLAQDLKKISAVRRITVHQLRHSFCSFLDSTGMSRRIVSEILGHADLATTNRYSHVNNKMMGNEVVRWFQSQNQQNSNNEDPDP